MKNYITISVIFACTMMLACSTGAQMTANAPENNALFTIYLVRHAEKQSISNDPPLTECGMQRSVSLRTFFDTVPLEAVYSTDYKRTQSTALPVANAKGITVQPYSGQTLEEVAKQLLKNGQDALVVGHSNTTGVLAGLLVDEEIGAFDESIYNRVYQVVVSKNKRRLHVFHTAFHCEE